VLGRTVGDDGVVVGYAVFVHDRGVALPLAPSELAPTGRHDHRESFYDGITVSPRGLPVDQ